MQAKGPNC